MFEFFIAKKYLRTKNKLNFISIISILSTLGITIGVAALIIVISVFNGFGDLAKKMLIESQPHMRIINKSEQANIEINNIEDLLKNNKMVSAYSPYLQGKIVITNNSTFQILDIKGLQRVQSDSLWGIESKLLSGSLDFTNNPKTPQALLSLATAMKLSARIGDTLTATSLRSIENMITNFLVIPNTQQFIISGIYQTANKSNEAFILYTSLTAAKRILGTSDISGFEVKLRNYETAETVKKNIESKIDTKLFSVETWYDMNKEFYNVLLLERWGAFILLLLIISVATFNILGSLTMSVIEKRRDIGILRSMGASKNSILKIFMFEGILIGIIGTVLGFIIGIAICYLQMEFKLYPLDPTKYIIDAIPIKLQVSDLVIIPIVSMLLSFFASLYPAKRAVKLNVIDTIKYE
ncbi:MAG: ABC transporter permease [Bacteroidetes bacterium]|nr:ABC transporter permease [Bacteroidota bacterium]MBU1115369.1 ABC transporter permease [Bacteroidota bacterium]MBU1799494.1 ABC transporter permease [Bacteroidota bacterium]